MIRNHLSAAERRLEHREQIMRRHIKSNLPHLLKPAAEPYVLKADGREFDVFWCPAMRTPIPREPTQEKP